ncbi:MAG TPA: GNAT family N-acetyltransferase [Kofleriaceae bacterium]
MAPVLSEQEILDEVMVVTRRSYPPLPDLRVIERPGWLQIITPSIKTGGLNEVLFSALDEREADAIIDAAVAGYRALGVKFRWSVGPGSAPADLGARLERRGLEASWGRGMARSTAAPADGAGPRSISIAEVDAASVAAFSDVMARGWEVDPAVTLELNARILATHGRQHMFLASYRGEPAATASYVAFDRSAYLIGGVVLPQHRGRGLYRALVLARLRHACARGIALATSHAREATSAPILERMGFETVCRYPRYFG